LYLTQPIQNTFAPFEIVTSGTSLGMPFRAFACWSCNYPVLHVGSSPRARVIRNLINVFKERVLLPELCGAISLLFCVDGPDALAHRTLRLQTCQLMDPPRLGTVLEDVAFLRQLQSNGTLPAQINALLEAMSAKVTPLSKLAGSFPCS
jgi:hypothetical protein